VKRPCTLVGTLPATAGVLLLGQRLEVTGGPVARAMVLVIAGGIITAEAL
jgi:hypothetical protein